MAVLTIRISDDKHKRLKTLAQHKQMSVNKLMEALSTQALAEFDSETRFRLLAGQGDISKALGLLDQLDTHFSKK